MIQTVAISSSVHAWAAIRSSPVWPDDIRKHRIVTTVEGDEPSLSIQGGRRDQRVSQSRTVA